MYLKRKGLKLIPPTYSIKIISESISKMSFGYDNSKSMFIGLALKSYQRKTKLQICSLGRIAPKIELRKKALEKIASQIPAPKNHFG